MKELGKILRAARLAAGFETQESAAKALKKNASIRASQSLIAQYELGKVTDPDPQVLAALSLQYQLDYMALVYAIICEKYCPLNDWSSLDKCRLDLFESSLTRRSKINGVEGLEDHQLRAKAEIVRSLEVLDVNGTLQWEQSFPNLKQLWIVAPNFLDDVNEDVFSTATKLLSQANIIYFVSEKDIQAGGRFWAIAQRFEKLLGAAAKRVHAVRLKDDQIRWIHTDLVIANAHRRGEAAGFQYIRQGGRPKYAIAMDPHDLWAAIDGLMKWAAHDSIFTEKQKILLGA